MVLILNTSITDNTGPATKYSFKRQTSNVDDSVWCFGPLLRQPRLPVDRVSVSRLPVTAELPLNFTEPDSIPLMQARIFSKKNSPQSNNVKKKACVFAEGSHLISRRQISNTVAAT